MTLTSIEWTDASWSPVTGCSRGCSYCYARKMARRLQAMGQPRYQDGFAVRFHPEALAEPLHWRKPRMVFVCSMGDLFGPEVTNEQIAAVFGVMAACPQHTFQVLTKCAGRLPEWFGWAALDRPVPQHCGHAHHDRLRVVWEAWRTGLPVSDWMPLTHGPWPLLNAWVGVSITGPGELHRLDHLRKIPATVRFVSFEPLLEAVGGIDLTGIHWVIVGSDSTRGAPPMRKSWVRDIRDQCVAASVPTFYKQRLENGRKVSMPELDGRVWAQFPEAPMR